MTQNASAKGEGEASVAPSSSKTQFFDDPAMDAFVAVVMNLAQETWVQEERILALEEARSGDPIDREAKVKEFIDRVFAPLRGV